MPSSIEGYYNKWIKSENIGNGECHGTGTYEKLLTALSKVVGFLNMVKLDQRPGSMTEQEPNKNGNPDETKLYELQQYDGKTIQVQVSYQNKRCYRILTHKPHGSDSQGQGYRLGTIIFSNSNTNNSEISYDLKRQLISVSLCYYVYDNEYEYPFLVVLEFKDGKNKYYKLTTSGKSYQWAKMENNNTDNVEELARRVKDELQIDFTNKRKKSHLFDPKDCNEHSSSGAVAGTLSTLGLTALGTGVAYYKYPEVFETLYRRLVHLIRLRSYY
ncbi:hypothetical protein MACJ_003705 [Theileria orientalis]|uniref:Uncharacterized protein n=1 Tax=Theileria orientalis TaxID=68886 RepID=A0A976SLC1_THEOR|nr:hypothetical protein MACJ_003705 [Theileria orientalis]